MNILIRAALSLLEGGAYFNVDAKSVFPFILIIKFVILIVYLTLKYLVSLFSLFLFVHIC